MFRTHFIIVVAVCCTWSVVPVPRAEAAFSDMFAYVPPGSFGDPLAGNGSWLPTGVTSSRIELFTPTGVFLENDCTHVGNQDIAFVSGLTESGTVSVRFFVRGSSSHKLNRDWWSFTLFTDTGTSLIRWTGKSDELTFWGPGSTYIFPLWVNNGLPQLLVQADINFNTGRINYFFNGTRANAPSSYSPPSWSQPCPYVVPGEGQMRIDLGDDHFTPGTVGNYLAQVQLESFALPRGQPGSPDFNDFDLERVYFNKLTIDSPENMDLMVTIPEPSCLALLALGGLAMLRRRK